MTTPRADYDTAAGGDLSLIVRRTLPAPPERVFAAWTRPELLTQWWGPGHVTCTAAEVDLRVGGRYRLANEHEDKSVAWISGRFEVIDRPRKLVYSWAFEDEAGNIPPPEQCTRVTVRFEPRADETEVIVVHERFSDAPTRDMHGQGWEQCVDGLARLLESLEARA